MAVVFIVPTGIGAEIGGHAGDATPAARLMAAVCDTLIVHPNVVNASDINEMTENMLYVEGSTLDRFLEGAVTLQPVKSNRILVVVNPPAQVDTINAVSAARATLGIDARILELARPLELTATVDGHQAGGMVRGAQELVAQVQGERFDALAIATPITVDPAVAMRYLQRGGTNPWGGVEAKASRYISEALDKPVAHAPVENGSCDGFNEVGDPRMAAELVSKCYLHCVLKGLHRAPRFGWRPPGGGSLSRSDVEAMVTPVGCYGRPHKACINFGIPVIAVRDNRTKGRARVRAEFIYVENYLEAAGYLAAMRAGISPAATCRPLRETKVTKATETKGT